MMFCNIIKGQNIIYAYYRYIIDDIRIMYPRGGGIGGYST